MVNRPTVRHLRAAAPDFFACFQTIRGLDATCSQSVPGLYGKLDFPPENSKHTAKGAARDLTSHRNVGQVFLSLGSAVIP